jgi:hypothetical protein
MCSFDAGARTTQQISLADPADRGGAATLDRNLDSDRLAPKPVHHGDAADHRAMHHSFVFYRRQMICIASSGRGSIMSLCVRQSA